MVVKFGEIVAEQEGWEEEGGMGCRRRVLLPGRVKRRRMETTMMLVVGRQDV